MNQKDIEFSIDIGAQTNELLDKMEMELQSVPRPP
jgi:hypothetical protein